MGATERIIVIAGAGIGGLAAAVALAAAGFDIVVIEQRPSLPEEGAGIQLGPNAVRALAQLGVQESLAGTAVVPDVLRMHSGTTGRELATMPLGTEMIRRFGAPYWTLHRAELVDALYQRCKAEPRIDIRFGVALADFAVTAGGVTVTCGNGSQIRGAALVGADGLWSRVRERLGDRHAPRASGKAAWRALVAPDRLPAAIGGGNVGLWLSPGAHVVHYPVQGGRRVNLVVVVDDPLRSSDWSEPADGNELLRRLNGWPVEVCGAVAAADGWRRWALWERPVARPWTSSCIALLGDAAHPVLPFFAQGAALALEDAVTLRECSQAASSDVAGAFACYERLRRPRAERVRTASRRNGVIYHMRGPAAFARDLSLRVMPVGRLIERLDWLYGFDAGQT